MRVGPWLLCLLPVLAVAELVGHEYFRHRAPNEQDWAELEPRVRALYRPGTLVTVVPQWADPLLRLQLGTAYFPLDILGRSDNDDLERAIVVSFMGQSDHELWRWESKQTETVGPFTVQLFENPHPERPKRRLIEHIEPPYLEVFDGQSGDPKVCVYTQHARVTTGGLGGEPTMPASRYLCPSGEPYGVAVTTIDDEAFRPRRCIYAHPSPNGPLTLLFHDVPLGKKIVGHAGMPWLMSRGGTGAPIELTARLDGERLGRHVVVDQEGYQRFEWDTRSRDNQQADIELTIATENPQNRRLCFTLETR